MPALLDLCFALLDGAGIMPYYRTALEAADAVALRREYPYDDPIHLLSAEGQAWRRARQLDGAGTSSLTG